ncbi:fungal-specific transcription factor domain-containing protein [Bisporella sp. PMI_857]|nr:fungal-specific transcription factor domain-containing protein [Bisporella sp. PMI_857]
MESFSPQDGESRRKRRRQSSGSAMRMSDTASSPQELGHMRPSLMKGSSSFVGSGSGIYFVRTVQSSFARNYRQDSEAIDDELVPGEDDRLQTNGPPGSLWYPDEITTNQPSDSVSFDDLVRWSQPYFNNWHPPFPFLYAPSVLGLMEKISNHGIDSLSMVDTIVVRSVLSISVADRRQMLPDKQALVPSNLIFNTIDDAISCLTPIVIQPSTFASLQALMSIQVFLVSMLRLNAASRIGGLILRMAFHLGLHRCPSRYKQFSSADVDMRRRLFWAIYSLERYLSQSLGLPLDLKDDDIDVCFPDKELHAEGQEADNIHSHDPRLLLPAFLARHGRIKGLILELRHKALVHRTTDPEEVAFVDAEISKWWNEAQDLVDPHYSFSEHSEQGHGDQVLLKDSHKLLLIVQKHESTILLNRPVITSGYNTLLFSVAMQKCIGASKQIVSKVYQHLHDGKETMAFDGRTNNPLFWPGFTWCIWMSGLILLYAASEGHYSVHIAQREADRCVKILEVLSLRGNFWPGACASALKDLQNALTKKIPIRTPSQSVNTQQRTMETPDSHLHGVSSRLSQSQRTELTSTTVASQTYASPSMPYSESNGLKRIDAQHSSNTNQRLAQNAFTRPATSTSRGTQSVIPQKEQTPHSQAHPLMNEEWSALNGAQYPLGEHFDGFDDIFQLMDVSYQLNEQYDPSNAVRHMS